MNLHCPNHFARAPRCLGALLGLLFFLTASHAEPAGDGRWLLIFETSSVMKKNLPATEAATFFGAEPHAHRAYPVVGEGGRLVGIVTRAEALHWLQKPPPRGLTLYDLTSDNALPCATPDDTVAHIVDLMLATDTGRVPIVDAQGRLAGLVARKDILRLRAASGALERQREAFFPGRRMAG